jgi:GNAT superfamily N-acetyltransferase
MPYSYDRRIAGTTPLPPSFPASEIGLMTKEEFLEFRNPKEKFHPQEAYDFDLFKMNRAITSRIGRFGRDDFWVEKYSDGHLISDDDRPVGVIHNGTLYYANSGLKNKLLDIKWGVFNRRSDEKILIEVKSAKQVKYLSEVMHLINPVAKRNRSYYPISLQHIIVKGEPMTVRAEKQPQKDKGVGLAILNSEGLQVAGASDEWGATLLTVAREYRGKGLGKLIGKFWYDFNPEWGSGGFTEAGKENALALWRDRIREFSARGWYTDLIRKGQITYARVKDILKGVGQRPPSRREVEEIKVRPTGDILVFSDEVTFVVYDQAFLEEPDERFIHGYGFFRDARVGTFIFRIDYDRPFAKLTTQVALQIAKDNGDRLYDGEGYSDMLELKGIPGIEREGDYITVTRNLINVRSLASKEKRLRKAVDPYDEKYVLLIEMAESKWN